MRRGIVAVLDEPRSTNGKSTRGADGAGPKDRKVAPGTARTARYPARVTGTDMRPRTVGEILDAACFVYRRHFARLVLVSLAVSLPAIVVAIVFSEGAAAAVSAWWDALMEGARKNRDGDLFAALRTSMDAADKVQGFALLAGVLQSFERAAGVVTMSVAAAAALGRETMPSVGRIFREAAPRLPAVVLAQVVLDYVLGTCLGCCFPVGIVLFVMASCVAPAIARGRGSMEISLRAAVPAVLSWPLLPFVAAMDGVVRSVRLTAHGPTLARGTAFVCILLTFVGIANAAAIGLGVIFAAKSGGWFWAQHCSEAVVLPVWGLAVTFWYADLVARREGADLEPAA
jgi:hypothetical protein